MAVRQLRQRELFAGAEAVAQGGLAAELADFRAFGTATLVSTTVVAAAGRPTPGIYVWPSVA